MKHKYPTRLSGEQLCKLAQDRDGCVLSKNPESTSCETCNGLHDEVQAVLHDLKNMLMILLEDVPHPCPFHQEKAAAAERIAARVKGLEKRLSNGVAPAVEQVVSVNKFLKICPVAAFLHRCEFAVNWHFDLNKEDKQQKVLLVSSFDDALIDNLASNWKNAGVTEIHVTLHVDAANNVLVVELADNGCGMTQTELEKIRTGPMLGEGEAGRGCQIIRKVCAQMGRTVSWKSIKHLGTQITLRYRIA